MSQVAGEIFWVFGYNREWQYSSFDFYINTGRLLKKCFLMSRSGALKLVVSHEKQAMWITASRRLAVLAVWMLARRETLARAGAMAL